GGNTCHPQTMVQPFARSYHVKGDTIYLCMDPMDSKHFAHPVRADQLSVDGINWEDIPREINALGSRYALVIKGLRASEFRLPLDTTRVAIGNSMGMQGSRYVRGRVDKACLEITQGASPEEQDGPVIRLVAEVVEPYAVYLRTRAI